MLIQLPRELLDEGIPREGPYSRWTLSDQGVRAVSDFFVSKYLEDKRTAYMEERREKDVKDKEEFLAARNWSA